MSQCNPSERKVIISFLLLLLLFGWSLFFWNVPPGCQDREHFRNLKKKKKGTIKRLEVISRNGAIKGLRPIKSRGKAQWRFVEGWGVGGGRGKFSGGLGSVLGTGAGSVLGLKI